jgi:predicted Zn-dependent peptidase
MKINETIRKDGLRIISCHIPHKRSVVVELIARVGYAYDPPEKPGLFHVFEHMAFKGTKKRSVKDLQSLASQNFFGRNATTGGLGTTYEVMAVDRKLSLACEYLTDIYFNSIFPAAEFEKEKRPILLEIARGNDDDATVAGRTLWDHLYKDNPLRFRGGGTVEGLQKIRRTDLLKEKSRWHVPANTIALAIGNVDHHNFVREINKRVPSNFQKAVMREWLDEANDLPVEREVTITRPKREKAILLFGCKIPLDIDLRSFEAMAFLNKMMGGSSGSRLWNEIREKRGLAYMIDSNYGATVGLGASFSVYAEIDPSKCEQAEKLIWQSLARPFTDQRKLEEVRELMFDAFEVVAVEQSNFQRFEHLIWGKISEGKPVKSAEREDKRRLKIISTLSLKDIENVRKKFIRPERFVRVLLKPE